MRRDQSAEFVDLLVVQAAGRLVEQQELRLGRKRAAEFDALLGAERQAADQRFGDFGEVEIVHDLVDLGVNGRFLTARPWQVQAVEMMSPLVR